MKTTMGAAVGTTPTVGRLGQDRYSGENQGDAGDGARNQEALDLSCHRSISITTADFGVGVGPSFRSPLLG
jgi:hypothetical protein